MQENIIHGAAARALMVFHDFPSSLWNGSKKIIHKSYPKQTEFEAHQHRNAPSQTRIALI